MTDSKLSSSRLSLIWFGAALSIAEIMTGTYFAPLGFSDGLLAIIIGHVIGCLLLFGAGLIGAREHMSSMQTVSTVFGNGGMKLFSISGGAERGVRLARRDGVAGAGGGGPKL